MEQINFVDLKKQYSSISSEIDESISNVISKSAYIKGEYVEKFEYEFRHKYNVEHCISVANGTDAIYIVLKMLGITEGDEVITTSHSWISTAETIALTGATPVFVDTDDYYTINADHIESRINQKTKAIIPVHLYGQPCDMEKINAIANKYNLYVIEDCAQAHFAEYKGLKVGTLGIASTFSFFPSKNLGAYGDAGAILTNDDQLAQKCRMFANHGAIKKHQHEIWGINSRMDGLQAAVLSVKLRYIDEWNQVRLQNALHYNELLQSIPEVTTPQIREHTKHVFHIYCIQSEMRDELQKYLSACNVETQIHYPTMLPFLPAFRYLESDSSCFPMASLKSPKILSLPMYPELTKKQIEYICSLISRFFNK